MYSARQFGRHAVLAAEGVIGRRHVVRAARFVWLQARRDGVNDMQRNGEILVQRLLVNAEPAAVVLDVGAHHGEWTRSLLAHSGRKDLRVFCVEPSAGTYAQLLQETRAAHGVEFRQVAFGDEAGLARLNVVHPGAGSNSLLPFLHMSTTNGERQEEVIVDTLNAFCERERLDRVTMLKVDAEGFDPRVLRGASALLARQAIGLIQFEYNHRWIHGRAFLKDAFDLLGPFGYAIGKVTPDGIEEYEAWHPELETFREANYLAFLPYWRQHLPRIRWWGP